jgi:hypothetical protein
MAKGFQKKSDRQIFVGYSNDRKGWLCFDTKTFRITTSIHLTFDEDFNNRRSAFISYDKHLEAGAYGVSPDEKRALKLVRELYRPSDRDFLVETSDAPSEGREMPREAEAGGKKQAAVPADSDRKEARRQRPTAHKKNTPRIADPVTAVDREEESDPDESDAHDVDHREPAPVEQVIPPPTDVDLVRLPQRRLPPGRVQTITDDEVEALERMFTVDWPISFVEKNPKRKGADSNKRFESYRHALTIRDALRKGASWQDILWDFERYYLAPNAARANQAQAVLDYRARGISSIPAAVVNDEGNALTTDIYSCLTLQESLQLDYAHMAEDHLDSLKPATRRLLKIALKMKPPSLSLPSLVPLAFLLMNR